MPGAHVTRQGREAYAARDCSVSRPSRATPCLPNGAVHQDRYRHVTVVPVFVFSAEATHAVIPMIILHVLKRDRVRHPITWVCLRRSLLNPRYRPVNCFVCPKWQRVPWHPFRIVRQSFVIHLVLQCLLFSALKDRDWVGCGVVSAAVRPSEATQADNCSNEETDKGNVAPAHHYAVYSHPCFGLHLSSPNDERDRTANPPRVSRMVHALVRHPLCSSFLILLRHCDQ